ncbi:FxsA family protein [Nakamurella flavida]|uniref:FxsA family protein n=1 Tax=Nakamurella flavida TaxID=363630 RepID=A0A938YIS8_9ACTN|nr:FxsA family protein [Nakamurella flavida]MBM9475376.1 FxsA family protein [Nakamurella flavida]MDP9776956.1 UPF0716 protein FxsA [Nakamurella flavida]
MAAIALFVILELVVLLGVGSLIGAGWTLLLVLATSALGIWLARTQGARALTDLTRAVRERRQPQNEVTDGLLIGGGAMLMVLPGFIGDLVGLALILPPTRKLIRRRLVRAAQARAVALGVPGGGPVVDGGVIVDGPAAGPDARVGVIRVLGVGQVPTGAFADGARSTGLRRVHGEVIDADVVEGQVIDGVVVDGSRVDPDAGPAGGAARR